MPTRSTDILTLLANKQADFAGFDQATLGLLQKYRKALKRFGELDFLDSSAEPAAMDAVPLSEAVPVLLEPVELADPGRVAFAQTWRNREESYDWVRQHLTGVATFAVDGSQIYPSKDISIPVALIQVGWFENLHRPQGNYDKNIQLDLMTPADLKDLRGDLADRRVNMRRFQMETERLVEYIEDHSGDEECLVFLDGSLVATFAEAFDQETQLFYVDCLRRLLQASEDCRVPLVGYIDTSYAHDLTGLLQRGFDLPQVTSLHDAQVCHAGMQWGDRTPLLRCQRDVLNKFYGAFKHRITYTYLKTNDGYPARLELPLWIHEAGRLEQVLNWVRGEVVIGGGYPYAIETADQVAVLTMEDRNAFYRLLQDWSEREGLKLRLSRKMISKVRRR